MTCLQAPAASGRSRRHAALHPVRAGLFLAAGCMAIPWLATAALATDITITTDPPELWVQIDGASYKSPQTVSRPPGFPLQIAVDETQGTGGTRFQFASWSDGGDASHTVIVPSVATTYTAAFTTRYLLVTEAAPATGGAITASPVSAGGFYNAGQSVSLTALPAADYQFHGWSGDVTGDSNPVTLIMDAPKTAAAVFYPNTVITTDPVGLKVTITVTKNGSTTTTTAASPVVLSEAPGSTVWIATPSPQFVGQAKYDFLNWSDTLPLQHSVKIPTFPSTITARFQTKYKLTTGVNPPGAGTVSCNPVSSDCQNGGCYYLASSAVTLTAMPGAIYQFDNWAGNVSGTGNPVTVTMSGGVLATAKFSQIKYVVTTVPEHLAIRVDGQGSTAPHTFFWTPNTEHTIEVESPQGSDGTRHEFTAWSDGGDRSHTVIAPSLSTTYTATFRTSYLLTTSVEPAGTGTVAADPASADGYYGAGATVALTGAAAYGYEFTRWSGDLAGSANPEQIVLSSPKAVTATFSPVSFLATTNPAGLEVLVDGALYTAPQTFLWTPDTPHHIEVSSPQSGPGVEYLFTGWSDGGERSHDLIAPGVSTSYVATFRQRFALTASVDPPGAGTVDVAPGSQDGYYDSGTVIQLAATAGYGYEFAGWSGDAGGSSDPIEVTMDGPRTVVARFEPVKVVVTTIPAGLGILVDGASYTAPQTFTWTPDTPHTIAVGSPQGSATTQYVFSAWSDGGDRSHETMAPGVAATYTATFRTRYRVTTAVNPVGAGSVTATPPSPDGFYDAGATVQLAAAAGPGYEFASWSGGLGGAVNPQALVLSAPLFATANFSKPFTIASVPPGRFVTIDGATFPAPRVVKWIPGTSHLIGAPSPQAFASGSRYAFASWSDGGGAIHAVVAPVSPTTYTATFQAQYQLLASVTPVGTGIIALSPASQDGYFDSGTSVVLTATPGSGYEFSGWGGDLSGTGNPQSLLMWGPHSVTASFSAVTVVVTTEPVGLDIVVDGASFTAPHSFTWEPGSQHLVSVSSPLSGGPSRLVFSSWSDGGAQGHQVIAPDVSTTLTATYRQQYLLSTSVDPPGQGSIERYPPSQDGYYDAGGTVTLTAVPESGNRFAAWGGDLTGGANPGYITMVTPRTVTANFAPGYQVSTNPPGLSVVVDGASYTAPVAFPWEAGTRHTIEVNTPQSGDPGVRYEFTAWSDGLGRSHEVLVPQTSTTWTASFRTQVLLTTSASPAGGGTVTPAPGYYDAGTVVSLAATPSPGFQFLDWSGDVSGASSPTTVTMDTPRSVTADFTSGYVVTTVPAGLIMVVDGGPYTSPHVFPWEPGSRHTLDVLSPQPGGAGMRYVFDAWSDAGAQDHEIRAPDNPGTYTASFRVQYLLAVSVSPPGGGSVVPATGGFYDAGALVTLTATPSPGYQWVDWSGDASGSSPTTAVLMAAPRSVTARFTSGYVVTTIPAGLSVDVDLNNYTAPQAFSWEPGSAHTLGAPSPQPGGIGTRYVFADWSDFGAQSHDVTAPAASATYTASFAPQYLLTVSVNPPGGGTAAPPTGSFHDPGEVVSLAATAGAGYQFVEWSGDTGGANASTSVTMSAPRTVTANFTPGYMVTTDPVGMELVVDGAPPVPAPQTYLWVPGTQHTVDVVSPQPDAPGSRYVFASWSDGGAQTHAITAPVASATYTATLKKQYELTISVDPVNTGYVVPASGTFFDANVMLSLNATGTGGYAFVRWDGNVVNPYANPGSVLMDGAQALTVHFRPAYYVATDPVGLTFEAGGDTYTNPQTFLWNQGWQYLLHVDSPQAGAPGTQYVFLGWSDGGGQTHYVTVPPDPATYLASFVTQYQLTTTVNPPGSGQVLPLTGGFYSAGTVASLAAEAYPGYQFLNWGGDVTGTSGLTTVTMSAPREAIANFAPVDVTGVDALDAPVRFSLGSVLPNPGSGVRDLAFSIPSTARVTLRVFDVSGREVAVLVDAEMPRGRHRHRFSTEGWRSGIYYFRLEMAGQRRTGRMVVLN